MPYEVLLERIDSAAKAISRFAQTYMDVPRDDTSPEERRKLGEVERLLDQALEHFQ